MSTPLNIKLTKLTKNGGCSAKWAPGDLAEILQEIAPASINADQRALTGFEDFDDAAVYLLRDDLAAVLTVDFFTPIVDDPYEFGRISAANALSDIFAMGATPHVALNLLALDSQLDRRIVQGILQGGAEAVQAAGAHIMGGHTIDDDIPKYGLAVFGTVHPSEVLRNSGALAGDYLYLTKPLGVGIMNAAHKIALANDQDIQPAIASMMELNLAAAQAIKATIQQFSGCVHACTDVTGFGLAGHLHEMLAASDCSAQICFADLPILDGVIELAQQYCRPARSFDLAESALQFVELSTQLDNEDDKAMAILCDPQTSGGLLVAVAPEAAATFESEFLKLYKRPVNQIGFITENLSSASVSNNGRATMATSAIITVS